MDNPDHYITRWQTAGLLDDPTATAIRAYEQAQQRPSSRQRQVQWQVIVALILGGILLGAGVLLFVAAHWENVSPLVRTLMVLSMLVFFHGLGLLVHHRFPGFATAMQLLIDTCNLPHDKAHFSAGYKVSQTNQWEPGSWTWNISLAAERSPRTKTRRSSPNPRRYRADKPSRGPTL